MGNKTRIQVSIHPDLVKLAEERMSELYMSSFSGYLETLIREEHERRRHRALQEPGDVQPVPVTAAAAPVHYDKARKK